MSDRNIGIKLANGQFYPILKDAAPARKRLVVTTVKDDQPSVQIDLYRGEGAVADQASYIGSLVIENIAPRPKGEPDIRLDLTLDDSGELTAAARDETSGESKSLRVSLQALSEEEKYEVPDFEFEEEARDAASTDELPDLGEEYSALSEGDESYIGQTTEDFSMEEATPIEELSLDDSGFGEPKEEPGTVANPFEDGDSRGKPLREEEAEKPRKSGRVLWILLIVLAGIAIALGLGLLLYQCSASPGAKTEAPPPVAAPAPAPQATPTPAPPAPAPQPPPAAEAPKALPAGMAAWVRPEVAARPGMKPGVEYKIRWGDTLWDLSYVFYRDPWLYPRIARANKIRNPDLIISGTRIWIPPR